MFKYCGKANKRRAFPPWGIPTEMTWMLLDPTVNPTDPNALNDLKEQQALRGAERAADAAELAKYTTLGRLAKGRALLEKN